MTASDARSSTSSSRRPASEARPNVRASPPSTPSSTCPTAIATSPTPTRPVAIATAAATLAANAAHVTWGGVTPSRRRRNLMSGPRTRSESRLAAGAKSYMMPHPVQTDVAREEDGEQNPLLHPVRHADQPAAGDVRRVGIEGHLLEAHAVVHRHVRREEQDRHEGSEEDAQGDDPEECHRLLERRAPVVVSPVLETHCAQIKRRLHGVVHVHAHAEGVREHPVLPLEPHGLHAEGGREKVGDDGHGTDSAGRARPALHTRSRPSPIQARSSTRVTIAVYTPRRGSSPRSEEHTSELQSHVNLVCRLLLEKKKKKKNTTLLLKKKKKKKQK